MKVLIVHNAYQSRHTGGEDVVVEREMAGLKADLGAENVFQYIVSNDDIRPGQLALSIWGDRHHFRQLVTLIEQQQIDVVHVHNFFPLLTPLVFAAAKQTGRKVIHTLHNFRWWCLAGTFYRDGQNCEQCVATKVAWPAVAYGCYRQSHVQSLVAAAAFSWYKLKKHLQHIDAFFALSIFQKNKLAGLLPAEKIYLKPNLIDEPASLALSAPKAGYLFVGRLEAAKGIEVLLATWRKLPAHFRLTIVGSGEAEAQLRAEYASPNIIFTGKLPQVEVFEHMRQAKYFLHTSLAYETFGLTLIEALAQATPIIAFDRGGRSEFIRSGYNGFLCQPENLFDTLLNSFDFAFYEQLSRNAVESAKPFYASTVIAQQVALYEQILHEQKI